MRFIVISLLAIFSLNVFATTVTPQLFVQVINIPANQSVTVNENAVHLFRANCTAVTDISLEGSHVYEKGNYVDCKPSFDRYLGRALNGPVNDDMMLFPPFIPGGAQVGGTFFMQRSYQFSGGSGSGYFIKFTCANTASAGEESIRVQFKTTTYCE